MANRSDETTTLSDRREAFCAEYIIDFCAADAARRAGYAEISARQQGQRLLNQPDIQARVRELIDARMRRTEISADQTLNDLRELADMAMGRCGTPHSVLVAGQVVERPLRRVSIQGAARALELIGKHQGLFVERAEIAHRGLDELFDQIAAAPGRSTPQGRIKAGLDDGNGD